MGMKISLTDEQKEHWNQIDKICCIYQLKNLINGKIYIGQTKDFRKHISHYHTSINSPKIETLIIHSMRYFGEENFEAKILQLCKEEQLNELERKWIEKLHANNPDIGYNTYSLEYIHNILQPLEIDENLFHICG